MVRGTAGRTSWADPEARHTPSFSGACRAGGVPSVEGLVALAAITRLCAVPHELHESGRVAAALALPVSHQTAAKKCTVRESRGNSGDNLYLDNFKRQNVN